MGDKARSGFADTRAWLRSLRFAEVDPPGWELPAPDGTPDEAFLGWLDDAVTAGIEEAHVGVLGTVGADGRPDARVLILRDVSGGAWSVSGSAVSAKGAALQVNPVATLTFYWREHGRQVRISGPVVEGTESVDRDFHERSPLARAVALASRQSAPLESESEYQSAVDDARVRLEAHPWEVPEHWRVWRIKADRVEFWQADPGNRHLRRRFTRDGDAWTTQDLWP